MKKIIKENDPHKILFEKSSGEFLEFQKMGKKYSKITIGKNEAIIFFDPESTYEILVSKKDFFIKSVWQLGLKRLMGEGLITSEEPIHLHDKQTLIPAFNKNKKEEYVSKIFNFVNEEIEKWGEGKIDAYEKTKELCLQITLLSFFGEDSLQYSKEILKAMHFILEETFDENVEKNKEKMNMQNLLNIFQKIIERQKNEKNNNNLLDILLTKKDFFGNNFSDKKIKDHMATILFAGYVTISELISWLVFSIADNSQSMKKLEKEAEESIWIKENRGPSIKEVVNSKVSYQIVLEGLRMYPPVWNFPRQATEDVYIQNIFIPKGTTVVPSSYISHRNEKYYKDPELWNPERWTKEFERSLPRGAYFPFGMSSTKCLGAEFAVLEAQIFILCFAKKYKWENCLNDGAPKIYPKISLKPKNGIPIIIQKKDL